tara:strand:- start:26 stop:361 length:336 start_codon:yes stop_codon:yes gene_type:complete
VAVEDTSSTSYGDHVPFSNASESANDIRSFPAFQVFFVARRAEKRTTEREREEEEEEEEQSFSKGSEELRMDGMFALCDATRPLLDVVDIMRQRRDEFVRKKERFCVLEKQ